MNIPNLDIQVTYPTEIVGYVSHAPRANWCDIYIRSNTHIAQFEGWITYEDQQYGRGKGLQLAYAEDLSSDIFHKVNPDSTHSLIANTTLIQGDGRYRIGLYIKSDEGIWNEYFMFLTTQTSGEHKTYILNGSKLFVKDAGIV